MGMSEYDKWLEENQLEKIWSSGAEEKEYVVNGWIPVQVEMKVYGINQDDAVDNAKQQLKEGRYKVVDRELSELTDIETEEV